MPHALAQAVEIATTVLAVAGMGYYLAAILAAWVFLNQRRVQLAASALRRPANNSSSAVWAPGVSILKSLKGLDPGMLDAFRSHCRQTYAGDFELLFGVSSLADPAAAAVGQLKAEFPERAIRLIECPHRLGANGKVSTLVQLALHAQHEFLLINDSDITVSEHYLERVMACFAPSPIRMESAQAPVGLVTALYRGRAHGTLPSRLESLGIASDFMAGVLLSKWIEGGLRSARRSLFGARHWRSAADCCHSSIISPTTTNSEHACLMRATALS